MRVEWKYTIIDPGVPYVMTAGTTMTPLLFAKCLTTGEFYALICLSYILVVSRTINNKIYSVV